MSSSLNTMIEHAKDKLADSIINIVQCAGQVTLEIKREDIVKVCKSLRSENVFAFEQMIDICGVDYLDYGKESDRPKREGPRFAVVYHLLSVKHNRRVRVRVFLDDELPIVDSVVDIWNVANWYEREAFDLYGIIFEGHPDLRRILTDYGFVGHPFRKDFPLSGYVEMRYDPEKQRVVYEPVSIEPRSLTPRIIREEGYGGRDS